MPCVADTRARRTTRASVIRAAATAIGNTRIDRTVAHTGPTRPVPTRPVPTRPVHRAEASPEWIPNDTARSRAWADAPVTADQGETGIKFARAVAVADPPSTVDAATTTSAAATVGVQ